MRNHKIRNFLKSFLSLGFSAVTQKSHAEKLLRIKEVTYICSQTVDSHRSTIWWKKIHPQSSYSLILVSWGRQIIIGGLLIYLIKTVKPSNRSHLWKCVWCRRWWETEAWAIVTASMCVQCITFKHACFLKGRPGD